MKEFSSFIKTPIYTNTPDNIDFYHELLPIQHQRFNDTGADP